MSREQVGTELVQKSLSLSPQRAKEFATAVSSRPQHPSLVVVGTIYRELEWKWLEKLEVDLKFLLHSEQEFKYFGAFPVDEEFEIRTKLTRYRERETQALRMRWIHLETTFYRGDSYFLKSFTSFIVREPCEGKK